VSEESPAAADEGSEARIREIVGLLNAVVERVRAHYAAAIASSGLTPNQAKAVLVLDEAVPMRVLAARLNSDASNLTSVVDRLEDRGVLERQVDPNDRRVRLLALTGAGQELRDDLRASVFHRVPAVAGLSAADQELLRDLLRRVVEAS